jgi:hypothetical protein
MLTHWSSWALRCGVRVVYAAMIASRSVQIQLSPSRGPGKLGRRYRAVRPAVAELVAAESRWSALRTPCADVSIWWGSCPRGIAAMLASRSWTRMVATDVPALSACPTRRP